MYLMNGPRDSTRMRLALFVWLGFHDVLSVSAPSDGFKFKSRAKTTKSTPRWPRELFVCIHIYTLIFFIIIIRLQPKSAPFTLLLYHPRSSRSRDLLE